MDALLNIAGLGLGDRDSTLRHSVGYFVLLLTLTGVSWAVLLISGTQLFGFVGLAGFLLLVHAMASNDALAARLWGAFAVLAGFLAGALLVGWSPF